MGTSSGTRIWSWARIVFSASCPRSSSAQYPSVPRRARFRAAFPAARLSPPVAGRSCSAPGEGAGLGELDSVMKLFFNLAAMGCRRISCLYLPAVHMLPGRPVLVTPARLLEYELRTAHPVLLTGDAEVDQDDHGEHEYDDERHQAPDHGSGAGERREVGLPHDHDARGRGDHRDD